MLGNFAPQADAYARARPAYPGAIIDLIVRRVGVVRGELVADIGAGTGIFTRELVERGFRVTAIEPGAEMRVHGEAAVPQAKWNDGSFDDTRLETASQRWIVAAQALHWAKAETALPEIRRALAPSGAFTALWNDRNHDGHPLMEFARDAIQRHVPGFDEAYRARDWAAFLRSTGSFERVDYDEEHHEIAMDRERFLDLWRSHNRLTTLGGKAALALLLADLEHELDRQGIERFDVPYVCRAWTAWPA
jgi:SAM-dependent methyltransferase